MIDIRERMIKFKFADDRIGGTIFFNKFSSTGFSMRMYCTSVMKAKWLLTPEDVGLTLSAIGQDIIAEARRKKEGKDA